MKMRKFLLIALPLFMIFLVILFFWFESSNNSGWEDVAFVGEHPVQPACLPDSNNLEMVKDRSNQIWFGKDCGIFVWNGEYLKNYTVQNSGLLSDKISDIAIGDNGEVWI